MQNPFDQFDNAPSQPSAQPPGAMTYGTPRPRLPSPQTPAQAEGDVLGNINTRGNIANRAFDNADKLRTEFQGLQEVKQYKDAANSLSGMLQAPDDAQGDLQVIYAFAKIMDPGSVVREGEMDLAQQTSSIIENIQRQYGRIGEGNRLPPNVRRGLVESARQKMSALNSTYGQAYKHYRGLASQHGFDPEQVTGPYTGDTVRPIEEQYIREAGGTPRHRDGTPVVLPDAPLGAPSPNEIQFGPDSRSDQEKRSQDFARQLQARVGRGDSVEDLVGWTESQGFQLRPEDIANIKKIRSDRLQFTVTPPPVLTPEEQAEAARRAQEGGKLSAVGYGGLDVMTMGQGNRLTAAMNAMQGNGDYDREVLIENEVDRQEQGAHPYYYGGGQLAGAVALPSFGARTIPQFARVGAGYGAAYGAGSSGSMAEVPMNALLGGATGFAVPHVLGKAGGVVKKGAAAAGRKIFGEATPEQQAILAAGQAEGVPVNMGDVFPTARNSLATLETIPGSSGPVRGGIEAGRDAMEGRVAALGAQGTTRTEGAMGERLYKAGERAIATHGKITDRDYGIAERLGGSVKAEPAKAAQAAREVIGELSETENINRSTITLYKDILADFLDPNGNLKPLSIKAVKGMRRAIRSEMSNRGLTGSTEDANLQRVVNAASEDMFDALRAHDPRAAMAYKKADEGFAERISYINDTLQKFMGTRDRPLSGEALMAKIRGMAGSGSRGNSREMAQFWRSLSDDEHADVAATVAASLGRRSAEEPFSPATFLTNIRNIDKRAQIVIFGRKGARSIDNLITLANAKKGAVDRLNNSRSGQVTNYRTVIATVIGGLPGGGAALGLMANAPGAGAAGGAAAATVGLGALGLSRAWAKALMNEDFTRLVANAPATTNPRVIDAHFGKLRQVATKDPNVRAVVEDLERKMLSLANDNMGGASRAAAEPESEQ